jgi:hypothetical protein
VPPRDEVAGELPEALRLILEKDRLVEADQIRINVQDKTIILEGFVATEEEKEMAEADAWCLYRVSRFALGRFLGVPEEGSPPRVLVAGSLCQAYKDAFTASLGGVPPLALYLTDLG